MYNKGISAYLVLLYDSFVFFDTLEKIKSGLEMKKGCAFRAYEHIVRSLTESLTVRRSLPKGYLRVVTIRY
jgi:hypothetical protein